MEIKQRNKFPKLTVGMKFSKKEHLISSDLVTRGSLNRWYDSFFIFCMLTDPWSIIQETKQPIWVFHIARTNERTTKDKVNMHYMYS